MAKRTWEFRLEDGAHVVHLKHGFITGRKAIRVDGKLLPLPGSTQFCDMGGDYPFQMAEHLVVVHIRTNGLTFSYDLTIDGCSIETGKRPDFSPTPQQRRLFRIFASIYAIAAGCLVIWLDDDWITAGLVIGAGVLGLAGVNIFSGGPLDKRND